MPDQPSLQLVNSMLGDPRRLATPNMPAEYQTNPLDPKGHVDYETGNLIQGNLEGPPSFGSQLRRGWLAGLDTLKNHFYNSWDPTGSTMFPEAAMLMPLGLSMGNPANALKLQDLMHNKLAQEAGLTLDEFRALIKSYTEDQVKEMRPRIAKAFTEAKYPTNTGISTIELKPSKYGFGPSGFTQTKGSDMTPAQRVGISRNYTGPQMRAMPEAEIKALHATGEKPVNTLYSSPDSGLEDLAENVNTLTHETQHGVQWKRKPVELTQTYKYPSEGHQDYLDQSWEKEARQAGETGANALKKFIEHLRNFKGNSSNLLDLGTPVDKNFINEYAMQAAAKRDLENMRIFHDPNSAGLLKTSRDNIRYLLDKAAQTATGKLPRYFSPIDVERAVSWLEPGNNMPEFTKYLKSKGYTGVTGGSSSGFWRDRINKAMVGDDLSLILGR